MCVGHATQHVAFDKDSCTLQGHGKHGRPDIEGNPEHAHVHHAWAFMCRQLHQLIYVIQCDIKGIWLQHDVNSLPCMLHGARLSQHAIVTRRARLADLSKEQVSVTVGLPSNSVVS